MMDVFGRFVLFIMVGWWTFFMGKFLVYCLFNVDFRWGQSRMSSREMGKSWVQKMLRRGWPAALVFLGAPLLGEGPHKLWPYGVPFILAMMLFIWAMVSGLKDVLIEFRAMSDRVEMVAKLMGLAFAVFFVSFLTEDILSAQGFW